MGLVMLIVFQIGCDHSSSTASAYRSPAPERKVESNIDEQAAIKIVLNKYKAGTRNFNEKELRNKYNLSIYLIDRGWQVCIYPKSPESKKTEECYIVDRVTGSIIDTFTGQ